MDKHRQFLFFCEGSPERGLGHVGRCLALADAIRSEHNQISRFVFRGSETALSKITEAGFEVSLVENFNEWQFTDGDVVILDLLIPLKDSFFNRAAQSDVLLCTLDDPTPNRLKCDLAFYPPVPQVKKLGWEDFKGELFWDWRFIPLRKEFAKCQPKHSKESTPKLLITMGGSDPDGLTLKVLQALKSLPGNWSAKVIAGPMLMGLDKIKDIAVVLGERVEILCNVNNMAELMTETDIAVASFGMTAYELAACGVPQLLLSLTDDHARSASALHQCGAAVSLGRYDLVSIRNLQAALTELLSNKQLRVNMAEKANELRTGDGASNIAHIIMSRRSKKRER